MIGIRFGELRRLQKSNTLFGSASMMHFLSIVFEEGAVSHITLYVVVAF